MLLTTDFRCWNLINERLEHLESLTGLKWSHINVGDKHIFSTKNIKYTENKSERSLSYSDDEMNLDIKVENATFEYLWALLKKVIKY